MSREKIVRLIETFHGEVNNGGFDQFFCNSAGNETAEIIQALEIIGAVKVATILKRAAGRFPKGMPPTDRTKRETLLQSVSPKTDGFKDLDQEFYSCSDDLTGSLEKYMDW